MTLAELDEDLAAGEAGVEASGGHGLAAPGCRVLPGPETVEGWEEVLGSFGARGGVSPYSRAAYRKREEMVPNYLADLRREI